MHALGERVGTAGGTLVVPDIVVGDVGTMAVSQHPTGAFITAWQPNTMPGSHTGSSASSAGRN